MASIELSSAEAAQAAHRPAIAAAMTVMMALIFTAAYAVSIGWPAWPVIDAAERIAYSAFGAALLAVGIAWVRSCWTRLPINAIAVAVCVLPTMWPMVRLTHWSAGELALWAAAVIISIALTATSAQRLSRTDGSILMPFIMLGMSAAGGGLLLMTGSIKLGSAGFGLAVGALLVVLAGLFVKSIRTSPSAITFVFAVLAGLFVSGWLWSKLPIPYAVAVFVAPWIAWVARVGPLKRASAWRRVLTALILAAAPAMAVTAVAAVKAYQESQRSADPYSDYY